MWSMPGHCRHHLLVFAQSSVTAVNHCNYTVTQKSSRFVFAHNIDICDELQAMRSSNMEWNGCRLLTNGVIDYKIV